MGEFESRWWAFASTQFDTAMDGFKCSDERSQDESMCCYCGQAL
jgi:hypothetical protein